MIPLAKLSTTPVTSSQPAQRMSAARVRSVRPARPAATPIATPAMSAAGSSHEIWPPTIELKSRSMPLDPLNEPPPPSPPVMRDSPL